MMNPVDEAILEGLLENRIYSVESSRFLVDRVHPRPRWTELKFAEMWAVVQHLRCYFGVPRLSDVRREPPQVHNSYIREGRPHAPRPVSP